jgi:hypothetical protein
MLPNPTSEEVTEIPCRRVFAGLLLPELREEPRKTRKMIGIDAENSFSIKKL